MPCFVSLSCMDGHLNCLHFLAVVPSDTVNICVQAFQYLFLIVSGMEWNFWVMWQFFV